MEGVERIIDTRLYINLNEFWYLFNLLKQYAIEAVANVMYKV